MTLRDPEEILSFFEARRSIRAFTDRAVSDGDIALMVRAASLAPTARNIQPWEFVVIRDKKRLKVLTEMVSPNGAMLGGAAVGILVFCKDTKYYLEDGCAAITQALLAAAGLGLGACWIAGDKKDYASRVGAFCRAGEGYRLVGLIAVGHPNERPSPTKRDVKDMMHRETF